jgi:hypothetical protein
MKVHNVTMEQWLNGRDKYGVMYTNESGCFTWFKIGHNSERPMMSRTSSGKQVARRYS